MNGEPNYKFVFKNEKRRSYQRISNLIIVANILVFLYLLLFPAGRNMMITAGVTLTCIFIYYLLKYFFYRPVLFRESVIFGVYHLFIIGFIAMELWIPAALAFILNILLFLATREYSISFFTDRIRYNTVPVKEISWNHLNHVVIKDGLLTIDMKNNKLLQEELDETKNNVDENEFNEFCRQHLDK